MIIWLASYPRSGNTFCRVLLKQFFGIETSSIHNDERDIGASQELATVVGHHSLKNDWDVEYTRLQDEEQINVVKTHGPPLDEGRAIYIVRDPYACVVSYKHYLDRFGRVEADFADVILGHVGFGSWSDHVESWSPSVRKSTLLLKYEDLVRDPLEAVGQLSTFLDISPRDANVPQFDDLQSISAGFFRSGSNEKNISELDESEKMLISHLYNDQMKVAGYEPLGDVDLSGVASILKAKADIGHKARHKLKWMENRNEVLKGHLHNRTERLQGAKEKISELNEEIAEQRLRVSELKRNITSLSEKLQHQKNRNEQLRIDLEKERKTTRRLNNARLELEKETGALRGALSRSEKEQIELREENRSLIDQNNLLTDHLSEVDKALPPRLSSIFTLKPYRYLMKRRQQIKAGELTLGQSGEFKRELLDRQISSSSTELQLDSEDLNPIPVVENRASVYDSISVTKPLGIAVFTHDRAAGVAAVLKSLELQSALENVHVWIDGDQGNPMRRRLVDETEKVVRQFPVASVHRNRGNFGFRKMMITAARSMFEQYDRVLFLEDDCFPTRTAIVGFGAELDRIEANNQCFSVYGHHFQVDGEEGLFPRFQGWGWATTKAKFESIWPQLLDCYLMTEQEYLKFVEQKLTPELQSKLDVTPGRNPSDTLTRFFAWDETLGMICALNGMGHSKSEERLIYNFGLGRGSTHFGENSRFREPPFNMIGASEIWDYF